MSARPTAASNIDRADSGSRARGASDIGQTTDLPLARERGSPASPTEALGGVFSCQTSTGGKALRKAYLITRADLSLVVPGAPPRTAPEQPTRACGRRHRHRALSVAPFHLQQKDQPEHMHRAAGQLPAHATRRRGPTLHRPCRLDGLRRPHFREPYEVPDPRRRSSGKLHPERQYLGKGGHRRGSGCP